MSSSKVGQFAAEVPTFAETARAAGDALRVARRKATATMSEFGDDAYETGARAREEISRRVEAQPLTAVLVAAGVGMLVGLMWARH